MKRGGVERVPARPVHVEGKPCRLQSASRLAEGLYLPFGPVFGGGTHIPCLIWIDQIRQGARAHGFHRSVSPRSSRFVFPGPESSAVASGNAPCSKTSVSGSSTSSLRSLRPSPIPPKR